MIILLVSIFFSCASKKVVNQLKFDEKANAEILYGACDLNGLKNAPFSEWYQSEFDDYQPDMDVLGKIESNGGLAELNISIVMGTWCSDSRREVPRFFKIFNMLSYEPNRIKIFCVDTKKQAEGTPVSVMNIERVPTFIFFKDKIELGRIIETPESSLEGDLLNILENL